MLTSGMVPALFPDDEKEVVIGQVQSSFLRHARRCLLHVSYDALQRFVRKP